jgi:hypothetical protein
MLRRTQTVNVVRLTPQYAAACSRVNRRGAIPRSASAGWVAAMEAAFFIFYSVTAAARHPTNPAAPSALVRWRKNRIAYTPANFERRAQYGGDTNHQRTQICRQGIAKLAGEKTGKSQILTCLPRGRRRVANSGSSKTLLTRILGAIPSASRIRCSA